MVSDIQLRPCSVFMSRRTSESSQAVLHYVLLLILGPRPVRACADVTRGPESSLVCWVRGAAGARARRQSSVVIRHGASPQLSETPAASASGTAASVLRHETRGAVQRGAGVTCTVTCGWQQWARGQWQRSDRVLRLLRHGEAGD